MRGPAWETYLREPLDLGGGLVVTASAVSMGNPHLVLFVDDDPERFHVAHIGAVLERDDRFPEGTNVEFAKVEEDEIVARVWERGSGETMACGSGACAIAVAANEAGLAGPRSLVRFPGGVLEVERLETGSVLLTGPASRVFETTIDLDALMDGGRDDDRGGTARGARRGARGHPVGEPARGGDPHGDPQGPARARSRSWTTRTRCSSRSRSGGRGRRWCSSPVTSTRCRSAGAPPAAATATRSTGGATSDMKSGLAVMESRLADATRIRARSTQRPRRRAAVLRTRRASVRRERARPAVRPAARRSRTRRSRSSSSRRRTGSSSDASAT